MVYRIIDMISKNVPTWEIMARLNLTNEEFLSLLAEIKDKLGYTIVKNSNDDLANYSFKYTIYEDCDREINEYDICVDKSEFKTLVIADTHLGDIGDRIDLLDEVYDYAVKNSIKYVFHVGDLINGIIYGLDLNDKHDSNTEQIDYALRNYPYERSITTVVLLGNHDIRPLHAETINLKKIINNRRNDMICLGYKFAKVYLNNDMIALYHPFEKDTVESHNYNIENACNGELPKIAFIGHSHSSNVYDEFKFLNVFVPCLFETRSRKIKGAWEATFHFTNSKIENIELKELNFVDDKLVTNNIYVNKIK